MFARKLIGVCGNLFPSAFENLFVQTVTSTKIAGIIPARHFTALTLAPCAPAFRARFSFVIVITRHRAHKGAAHRRGHL